MKKKRGIFAGRQQTPPAIPPTQISDAKLLADLDVEIAAAERAANPPEAPRRSSMHCPPASRP